LSSRKKCPTLSAQGPIARAHHWSRLPVAHSQKRHRRT
jgi:hypothetical protein